MPWLVREGEVLASLEVAADRRSRRRGLRGRDELDGGLVLRPCRSVHTVGMRFAIDVAFCDADGVVLHTASIGPNRVTRPVRRARWAVEVPVHALAHWGVRPGDVLEVRE